MSEVCEASKLLKGKEGFRKMVNCIAKDIAVTIYVRGRRFQVCRKCWMKIGKSDLEW